MQPHRELTQTADFGAWRSPISEHGDHPFRLIAITHFGVLITRFGHPDHFETEQKHELLNSWVLGAG